MERKLLEKYLRNKINEQELNMFFSWLKDSGDTAEGKALLHNIWEEIEDKDEVDEIGADTILNRIHHKINLIRSENLLAGEAQNSNKPYRKKYFLRILRNAAAILFLPVLGFVFYMSVKNPSVWSTQISYNQAYNEVYSSVDAITKVTLPDGSKVWLNHNSSLKYPAEFQEKFRTVELKGEGYFEVVHDSSIPFIVETGELKVIARGTTFNIMSYPDEGKVETSLISGIVDLSDSEFGKQGTTLLKMTPGNLATYDKASKVIVTKNIIDNRNFSWKDGKLMFSAEPMINVAKKLSRWFNADIVIKDPELAELTLTATFVNETLPEVMELLSLLTPMSYSISKRVGNSDGTFTKRQVILTYNKRALKLINNI